MQGIKREADPPTEGRWRKVVDKAVPQGQALVLANELTHKFFALGIRDIRDRVLSRKGRIEHLKNWR